MDQPANDNSGALSAATRKRCPICRKPAMVEFAPFCSKRCADVDLHRWLGEGYRVPIDHEIDDRPEPE